MRFKVSPIPRGLAGTLATVDVMARMVSEALSRPRIRLLALSLLKSANVDSRRPLVVAKVLFDFVRGHIAYVQDPIGVETVQEPEVTLDLGAGDCDDQVVLLAALAGSVGIASRAVVLGATVDRFEHIYLEFDLSGRWIAADTASNLPFGRRPPEIGVKRVLSIIKESEVNMANGVGAQPATRQQLGGLLKSYVWQYLSQGWNAGKIDLADVEAYLSAIRSGVVDYSGNTFFEPEMRGVVQAFADYIRVNNIKSRKRLMSGMAGLSGAGLSGFFGDLWDGVKSVIKPAAVAGATAVGGPAVGAAAAGVLYGPGGAAEPEPAPVPAAVTAPSVVPAVVPSPAPAVAPEPTAPVSMPAVTAPVPFYKATAAPAAGGLGVSPLLLIAGVAALLLLTRKK